MDTAPVLSRFQVFFDDVLDEVRRSKTFFFSRHLYPCPFPDSILRKSPDTKRRLAPKRSDLIRRHNNRTLFTGFSAGFQGSSALHPCGPPRRCHQNDRSGLTLMNRPDNGWRKTSCARMKKLRISNQQPAKCRHDEPVSNFTSIDHSKNVFQRTDNHLDVFHLVRSGSAGGENILSQESVTPVVLDGRIGMNISQGN